MTLELRLVTQRWETNACTLASFEFSDNTGHDGHTLVALGDDNKYNVAGVASLGYDTWAAYVALDPVPPPED